MQDQKQTVTIYTSGEFFGSIQAREGYLIEHGRKQYAQYKDAPFVKYIPKGKRKPVGFIKGYKPYLLIIDGWNMPQPQGMFDDPKIENDVIIKKSTYSSFDDRYKTDFDVVIDQYKDFFIADYRE